MAIVATVSTGTFLTPLCMSCSVRSASVCSAIKDQDVPRLAGIATVMDVAVGKLLIEAGEQALYFFNVSSGAAKLYRLLPDGRRHIIGFVRSGDFLGLAAGEDYAFSAEALTPLKVCRFTRKKLYDLLSDFPAMERRLLQAASNELAAAQDQMLLLGRKTARERVASFLRSEAAHTPSAQGHSWALLMTRGDMADYLGLTIETVSRTMTALRKCGVIAISTASDVSIEDTAALESIADGTLLN